MESALKSRGSVILDYLKMGAVKNKLFSHFRYARGGVELADFINVVGISNCELNRALGVAS